MTARETAVAAVLAAHRFQTTCSIDGTVDYGWCGGGDSWATKHITAHEAHVAAAIIAALDQPDPLTTARKIADRAAVALGAQLGNER